MQEMYRMAQARTWRAQQTVKAVNLFNPKTLPDIRDVLYVELIDKYVLIGTANGMVVQDRNTKTVRQIPIGKV